MIGALMVFLEANPNADYQSVQTVDEKESENGTII